MKTDNNNLWPDGKKTATWLMICRHISYSKDILILEIISLRAKHPWKWSHAFESKPWIYALKRRLVIYRYEEWDQSCFIRWSNSSQISLKRWLNNFFDRVSHAIFCNFSHRHCPSSNVVYLYHSRRCNVVYQEVFESNVSKDIIIYSSKTVLTTFLAKWRRGIIYHTTERVPFKENHAYLWQYVFYLTNRT